MSNNDIVKILAAARFKARSDSLENWQTKNPILLSGEPSVVTEGYTDKSQRIKFGDGVTPWKELDYWEGPKGDNSEVDQEYSPESENAQSGIAVAEGIDLNVGDINNALALIVEGSREIPTSILEKLTDNAGAEVVERLKPYAESYINQKLGELTADRSFKTAVKRLEAGSLNLEPNCIYGILVTGSVPNPDYTTENADTVSPTISGSCTVSVFDDNGTPVNVVGKFMGVVMGNYGDSSAEKAEALIAGYRNLAINKGIYTGKTADLQGNISWNSTALVVTIALHTEGT